MNVTALHAGLATIGGASGWPRPRPKNQPTPTRRVGKIQPTRSARSSRPSFAKETITDADIVRAVVEGARSGPPPARGPAVNELKLPPRDHAKLALIRTLLKDKSQQQAATSKPPASGTASPAHVDVTA